MPNVFNFFKRFWIVFLIIALYFILAGLNFMPNVLNIFHKEKLLIDDTPVIVKEINELGELTTSEFYGEVYSDINEVYDELIQNFKDSIDRNPAVFYKNYSGLKDYMAKAENFRLKELEYNTIKQNYESLLTEHLKQLETFRENEKKLNEELAAYGEERKERKAIKAKMDELRQNLENQKNKFLDAQKKYIENGNSFSKQKDEFWQSKKDRNLVYIGRGWVKAGINLKNLTEKDIIIEDSDSSLIQILIADPNILDADINPWFIYTDEKKIKGFEVFIAKTGSVFSDKNFTDFEVTQLKLKCKEKLKAEAIKKGLLSNAKTSTVQTLENFFRLLGFDKVEVHFKSSSIIETTSR